MIADTLEIFAALRSARIGRASLSARRISATFANVRKELGARTLHSSVRERDRASHVVWSLWIGRFEKPVPWLIAARFKETRYAFLFLLEQNGFVASLGSNIGDVAELVSDDRVSYQKLLALHSDAATEIESLSTRSLRAARVGVMRSTQSGRHLEQSLSRVGANQAAPFQVALRQADQAWRISPGSGRITVSGARATIPDLCAWFSTTCQDIERASEPSDFIKAFAHPIALTDLPADIVPNALQLDSSVVDDLLELGVTLRRNDTIMTDAEIEALRQLIRELWLVETPQTRSDIEAKTWRLTVHDIEVGKLVVRSTKISLVSDHLTEVQVVNEDGTSETLNHVFNAGSQQLRITFSDASYAYAAGQLFRDHRLLASRSALLEVLSDRLPPNASVEKGEANDRFDADSLFGFVVDHASANDQYLVCDDMGTEWADFIGVSTAQHQITFYHCKGGQVDVGASGLHEVVSQAAKNLGYLTASTAELESRSAKWERDWRDTAIPRLQRGAAVADFTAAFVKAVAAPQATRRVTLVTSSLSKAAVTRAFDDIDISSPRAEVFHVLWLLSVFVDQCRSIGAVPEIVCRP
jgi:hypothetical protein